MHFLVEGNLEKKPSVVFLSLQFSTFSNINLEKVNTKQNTDQNTNRYFHVQCKKFFLLKLVSLPAVVQRENVALLLFFDSQPSRWELHYRKVPNQDQKSRQYMEEE